MKISFFEEFPTEKNLSKLKLVNFPSKVFLASESYENFLNISNKFKQKNIEFIWWPLLPKNKGYWFSPFVPTKTLKSKLSSLPKSILWDAEFPKNRLLLLNPQFFHNKKLIKEFFHKNSKNIYTAEHTFGQSILEALGLSFPNQKNKVIKMMYSSMHKRAIEILHDEVKILHEKLGSRLVVGLGCLAPGILEDEPVITPGNLKRDLEFCKSLNIEEIVLFRLGGLNNKFLRIIKNYLT